MKKITDGGKKSIKQLIQFISELDSVTYLFVASPAFEATIGQHLRHVLDLYKALIHADSFHVNYNIRRRGSELETNKSLALIELEKTLVWLNLLTEERLSKKCVVAMEISVSEENLISVDSTYARELCYISCHLTHHLSSMAAIARLHGCNIDINYGIAPSTANFNRLQKA